ncbi:5-hydroxytryptamine receptor 1F-like protein [Leptotrombidium deliense]|uniref:5-hydroxytryptamine receptor 1F-like protein n=1 Tax=Leptotrombidium deliense TaxID=299467 RepID=A0A443S1C9_9ACAR|nr:5-hydroxytryptamine receptor 1F-like protein [Leptotrombidium deliense]
MLFYLQRLIQFVRNVASKCFDVCCDQLDSFKLRQPRNFLIFSLAITDFLVGLIVMPVVYFVKPNFHGNWPYGTTLCEIYWVIKITVVHVSILHLVVIAIDTYLSLKNAFYAQRRTAKKVTLMVLGIWFLGHLPSLLTLVYKDSEYETRINVNYSCYPSFDLLFLWINNTFGFWIPMIIICTLHYQIFKN